MNTMPLMIGRDAEKALLDEILESTKPELVAVYGRRRVGKTYLLRNYLKPSVCFEFSGIHNVTTEVQLENFTHALSLQLNNKTPLPIPANWFAALELLATLLKKRLRKRTVVFLDEFPWMQTSKSNFLAAFENFWNTWAVNQQNLIVVICGSAAGWMIQNVIRNKGGLHNRITRKIALQPFTLAETELFLQSKKVNLTRYQIVQLYMALGGIPHYLNEAKPGLSAAQIIEKACFSKNGFLHTEFTDLYKALFDEAERHIKIIRLLAAKPMGLTRNQLIKAGKV
jgi:AAA+ ATPase superfamily predicted ATPase